MVYKRGTGLDLRAGPQGGASPYEHLLSVPHHQVLLVYLNDNLFLLLLWFVPSDYCRIPKTEGYIVHRSTVVSTYWIWSGLHVSSSENMEVRLSGVLIIDYKRPFI